MITEEINVQLPKYLNEHYPYGKVHLLHSSERIGLMQARVKGAKEAIGMNCSFEKQNTLYM